MRLNKSRVEKELQFSIECPGKTLLRTWFLLEEEEVKGSLVLQAQLGPH